MAKTYRIPATLTSYYGTGSTLGRSPDGRGGKHSFTLNQVTYTGYFAGSRSTNSNRYGTLAEFDAGLSGIDPKAVQSVKATITRDHNCYTNSTFGVNCYYSVPTDAVEASMYTGNAVITANRVSSNFSGTPDAGTDGTQDFLFTTEKFEQIRDNGIVWYYRSGSDGRHIIFKDVTLVVETDETDYRLSYDPNGGTGAPAAQVVTGRGSATFTIASGIPTKTGYSFLGWATTSSASMEQYKAGQSINIEKDTILYAVWKPDEYAVTYNANGGNDAPAAQVKYHGTSLTLTADTPTKTGYTFRAWNTDQHGSGRDYLPSGIYTENSTVVLYAQWTANQYKVDCDGVEITVTYGEPYGALPVPHKDGYTFDGWGLEDGTYINASSIVTTAADHKLVSAWTPNRYIVEYTDTVSTIERPITQDQPWNAEGALFSRTGYSQVEWETDSGYSVPFGSEQRTWGNLVLYAVISPNEYTITFDSDGGTEFSPRHIYYNSKVGTLPKPTKDKHIFLGWYRNGVKWTAEKVYDLTENVTLTAMWQEESSGYTRAEVYVMTESGAKPASFGSIQADGSARYGEVYVIKES